MIAELAAAGRALWRDGVELARAERGDTRTASALRMMLGSDSYRITALCRLREVAVALHVPAVNHLLRVAQTALWAIDLGKEVVLGDGVYFVHPVGIVIGGDARLGARVRLYGNNTIGTIRDDGYPIIEDDVELGAGSRVLGPVRIGARSLVGANAVVLCDVPPDHVAVGVPARVLPRKDGSLPPARRRRGLAAASAPAHGR
jgi:serine O-acetyltransferase